MGKRNHAAIRCSECRMLVPLCICSLIPALDTKTKLLLVIHAYEIRKSTNTGVLATRCLAGSRVLVTGLPTGEPARIDDERALLLFPAVDAQPIEQFRDDGPWTLVVPDGTWRQAQKVRARVPGAQRLPCVTLPEGPTTSYRLRNERREGGLGTMEAISRAYAVLEGPEVAAALEEIFATMVERTLWSRGALHSASVRGGIPDGARAMIGHP